MLWVIFSILMVLWIIGIATQQMGGFIHILLALALLAAATELILSWWRKHMN